jgi:hypothetical protein
VGNDDEDLGTLALVSTDDLDTSTDPPLRPTLPPPQAEHRLSNFDKPVSPLDGFPDCCSRIPKDGLAKRKLEKDLNTQGTESSPDEIEPAFRRSFPTGVLRSTQVPAWITEGDAGPSVALCTPQRPTIIGKMKRKVTHLKLLYSENAIDDTLRN